MSIPARQVIQSTSPSSSWRKSDTLWLFSLYGTAIGAGVLFLPINAGVGGMLPLLVMALLAFPMTFYAHRGLARFVLSGRNPQGDITDVVEEHFGKRAGKIIVLLYFLAIYPILLMYSVAITNTVESLMVNQLHITPPPRAILALGLLVVLMTLVSFGQQLILKVMSVLVFPFVISLMLVAINLIPQWQIPTLDSLTLGIAGDGKHWLMTVWLAIPVLVFSFNHSPIISSFAVDNRNRYGADADRKCSKILFFTHVFMVMTVMFFVFSCVLSLRPADLLEAKEQNVSMLSYLANHFSMPFINWMGPLIAIVAISKSFLGHYLGAVEGFNAIFKGSETSGECKTRTCLTWVTPAFMLLTAWAIATFNPSILGMIESLGGPIIAMLLFLMPMYAIYTIPAMHRYRGSMSNIFIVVIGVIALTGICFSLFA